MTTDQVLTRLAEVRARLLAGAEAFDDPRFFARPPGGGWGAAHVIEHLVRVEDRIQKGARKTIEQGSDIRPTWYDPLLKLPMRTGLVDRVRVRTVKGADPLDDDGVTAFTRLQLMERLAGVRAGTVRLLEESRDRDLSRTYMRHPFFGAFAVREFLAWVGWHEDRHRRQLERIRVQLETR
jgi:hypothetical protein